MRKWNGFAAPWYRQRNTSSLVNVQWRGLPCGSLPSIYESFRNVSWPPSFRHQFSKTFWTERSSRIHQTALDEVWAKYVNSAIWKNYQTRNRTTLNLTSRMNCSLLTMQQRLWMSYHHCTEVQWAATQRKLLIWASKSLLPNRKEFRTVVNNKQCTNWNKNLERAVCRDQI